MRHSLRNVGMVALLLFLFLPSPTFAFVPRAGENVAFSQAIQDDLYIAGGNVTGTGTVDGDVTAAGGAVTGLRRGRRGVVARGGDAGNVGGVECKKCGTRAGGEGRVGGPAP